MGILIGVLVVMVIAIVVVGGGEHGPGRHTPERGDSHGSHAAGRHPGGSAVRVVPQPADAAEGGDVLGYDRPASSRPGRVS